MATRFLSRAKSAAPAEPREVRDASRLAPELAEKLAQIREGQAAAPVRALALAVRLHALPIRRAVGPRTSLPAPMPILRRGLAARALSQ